MKIVEIRGVRIGEGIPKICVSLMGSCKEQLEAEAIALREAGADLAEWRVDWFEEWTDPKQLIDALQAIRSGLGGLPLLVTFRTKAEGGQQWISCDQYEALYQTVLTSGQADLIDLELFLDETVIRKLIHSAKEAGVTTVLSNHDFQKTPEREELRNRLKRMELLGADIAKLAVMPRSGSDVADVLAVTAACAEEMQCPIITMAMGGKGAISRMAGQIFGSAVTFAALEKASAPGQIPLHQLKEVLHLVASLQ